MFCDCYDYLETRLKNISDYYAESVFLELFQFTHLGVTLVEYFNMMTDNHIDC